VILRVSERELATGTASARESGKEMGTEWEQVLERVKEQRWELDYTWPYERRFHPSVLPRQGRSVQGQDRDAVGQRQRWPGKRRSEQRGHLDLPFSDLKKCHSMSFCGDLLGTSG
jgi:hypothetical protein